MASEAAALWRAVLAAPHDDAPRLVYADWLDENGQPERAEFIRLQCRLAYDRSDQTAVARDRSLWDRNAEEWRAELPAPLRTYAFRRGFVYPELQNTRPVKFLRLQPVLLAAAPSWHLTLHPGTRRGLHKLIGAPGLGRLDSLTWSVAGHVSDLTTLLNGGTLVNLQSLRVFGDLTGWIAGDDIDPAGLPLLRHLRVEVGPLGRTATDWLAGTRLVSGLETFGLAGGRIRDEGVRRLFAAPRWPDLRELALPGNWLTAAGLESLLTNPALSGLRTLDLGSNPLGDEGARRLALWPGLQGIVQLNLSQTDLGPIGAQALSASPFLPGIQILSLGGNPAIRNPGTLSRLRARFGDRVRVDPFSISPE